MGDREGGALPTAHPTDTSTGTTGSTQPGDKVAKQLLFCVHRYRST